MRSCILCYQRTLYLSGSLDKVCYYSGLKGGMTHMMNEFLHRRGQIIINYDIFLTFTKGQHVFMDLQYASMKTRARLPGLVFFCGTS